MAKSKSTTPTVIPLDPEFNAYVDEIVAAVVAGGISEEVAREVVTLSLFKIQQYERDRAAGRVKGREFDPGRRYLVDWIKAASVEQRAELNAFMEATVKEGEGVEEVDAWLHEHEPRGMQQ
jgi:hypothetical protein